MPQATGLGGVFLRARDPKALHAWYEKHLGLPTGQGFFSIPAEHERAKITFAFFSEKSDYFPPTQPVMLNFQVDDLEALLKKLEADGVAVDSKRESADYGKFGWFTDPEGNRVELWEPTESPAKL
jgi:predicted enzyme related to lactoylglutathione lyase